MKTNKKNKYIINNKKIYYNYNIIKKFIAGVCLKGWEVKYIKNKKIDISKSYIKINKKREIYLINLNINFKKNILNYKNRKIKILLKKKEIKYLYNKTYTKGYTLVLINIKILKPWFKITIALAKGKKKYNKKKIIKKYKNNKKYIDLIS